MRVTIVGIDLAKSTFHLCGMNRRGRVVWRRREHRGSLLGFLRTLEPCRVVMEACGGSHYWAREIAALGHEPKLISGQFVKPYVKSNKHDVADAEAICEAGSRPTMRFVPVKTQAQQDLQALHRVRTQQIKWRTAAINQGRGLLLERGVTVPKGRRRFQRELPVLLEDPTLTGPFRELLRELYDEVQSLNQKIAALEAKVRHVCATTEAAQRLLEIPGVGPLSATALIAAVGNGADFKNGRHLAAWLGLVPRQFTTGGKPRLLGISKRGDRYVRQLLVHGARAVLYCPADLGRRQGWARALKERAGANKAAVGLANKNARIAWAVLRREERYRARPVSA